MTEQLIVNSSTDLSLPPIHAEIDHVSKTPVENDGSFSIKRVPKRFLPTPVDESTGVPLPIYPSEELPPVIWKKQQNITREADWHHPFHPRSALIQGTLAEQALRACRVQWARYEEHHDGVGYHQTFAGPIISEDELQLFKTIVFASAGFVGKDSLRFDERGQHTIHELDSSERKRLLKPGVITIDEATKVRSFLIDYGARNLLQHVNQKLVEELLYSTDVARKRELAAVFIASASEELTSGFSSEFRDAKRQRWLPQMRTGNAANYVRNLLVIQRDGSRTVNRQILRLLQNSLKTA